MLPRLCPCANRRGPAANRQSPLRRSNFACLSDTTNRFNEARFARWIESFALSNRSQQGPGHAGSFFFVRSHFENRIGMASQIVAPSRSAGRDVCLSNRRRRVRFPSRAPTLLHPDLAKWEGGCLQSRHERVRFARSGPRNDCWSSSEEERHDEGMRAGGSKPSSSTN